jgi:uncharacterized protein (TIGR00730 family)
MIAEGDMRRLCVFCGSRLGTKPIYAEAARDLGKLLVQRGWGLVFGGGHVGLMGVLADAMLEVGGEVVGVIPQGLVDRELAHSRCTQLHVTRTMHERKALMADLSNAFLALPGGYGTLDETFEMLTWVQLGLQAKPVGLLNIAGFFDALIFFLEHTVTEGFIKPSHRGLLLSAASPIALIGLLEQSQPAPSEEKWP